MAWQPEELKKVKDDLHAGISREVSVRELLRWFRSYRRGRHVVAQVGSALRALDLTTVPDFDSIWIDGSIRFEKRAEKGEQPSNPVVTTTVSSDVTPEPGMANEKASPHAEPHPAESPL